MSERKVLNKYYPPDFDPSKIPRMKLPKNRQYTVRLMAPFNMRCVTCGEYIYKGKKFNARKEDVEGQDYLGIRIYRFYIKCTRCLQEISFKTDPCNTDYEIEAGATRNFMALKLAEEAAQREEDERKEDEATNPMKLLENRTKQSKQELERLEALEEIRDLNRRQRTVDYDSMLLQYDNEEDTKRLAELQEQEDEKYIRSVYGPKKFLEAEIIERIDADGNVIKIEKRKNEMESIEIKTEPIDTDEIDEDNDGDEPVKKKKKKKHHKNYKIKEKEKKLEDSIDKQLKAIREQVDLQESKKSSAISMTTSTAAATTTAAATITSLSITEEIMPKKPQRVYKQETLIQTKPVHIERSTGELWNRSIGQMSKRASGLNLVKPKAAAAGAAPTSPAAANLASGSGQVQGMNALSMLGSYSGGSSDSD